MTYKFAVPLVQSERGGGSVRFLGLLSFLDSVVQVEF